MAAPDYMIVGRIRKPHGIRGAVIIQPLTDAPDAIFAPGRRVLAGTAHGELSPDDGELTIADVRSIEGGVLLAQMQEISDRDTASLWRGRYLLVPVSEIEAPREGEAFVHELRGMRVELSSGQLIGEVQEVYELPQGLGLDVSWRGESVILPFRPEFVRELDRAGRRIVMDLPEGLLD